MYAVYDLQTKALRSTGTVVADPLPDGLGVAGPFDVVAPFAWDAETLTLSSFVQPARTSMKTGNFMRRLGLQREAVLHAVRRNPATPSDTVGVLEALTQWAAREPRTDVTFDVTQQGVGVMAQVLQSVGQLAEGVEAFTAMMLALPTPEED
jgi:hypothetical protein